jgi:hypothetical protein
MQQRTRDGNGRQIGKMVWRWVCSGSGMELLEFLLGRRGGRYCVHLWPGQVHTTEAQEAATTWEEGAPSSRERSRPSHIVRRTGDRDFHLL